MKLTRNDRRLLISRLLQRSGSISFTQCTPFYALGATRVSFTSTPMRTARKTQEVASSKKVNLIRVSNIRVTYRQQTVENPADAKVTNQWRRGRRSRRFLYILNEMQIFISFCARNGNKTRSFNMSFYDATLFTLKFFRYFVCEKILAQQKPLQSSRFYV